MDTKQRRTQFLPLQCSEEKNPTQWEKERTLDLASGIETLSSRSGDKTPVQSQPTRLLNSQTNTKTLKLILKILMETLKLREIDPYK